MSSSRFLQACRGEMVDQIPVWFMRQAGRSLPGYRELRKKYDVLTLTRTPELAAQVSLEPVVRLGVDAAILFADIMLLPMALGVDVKIIDGVGPVIGQPIKNQSDIEALKNFDPAEIGYLAKTIEILRGELKIPLIGFAGAPFTLASYLIEGRPSRTWSITKQFMLTQSQAWHALMQTIAGATIKYLSVQIDAGAQAIQLFDSWVGCLSPLEYREFVLPYVQQIFNGISNKTVPRIYFSTNTAGLLGDFTQLNCEVIGVDWRIELSEAKKLIGNKVLQGNLDPAILVADWPTIEAHASKILQSISPKQGFIFNLGHGVLPETDDRKLKQLVEFIHAQ